MNRRTAFAGIMALVGSVTVASTGKGKGKQKNRCKMSIKCSDTGYLVCRDSGKADHSSDCFTTACREGIFTLVPRPCPEEWRAECPQ